mmetsp:Transcript_31857/g.74473  ORF Transcript_31857/g.74473 Transcript_31857/m.74473 type:complete len:88 (+) Transcript_31857:1300-1563(+)
MISLHHLASSDSQTSSSSIPRMEGVVTADWRCAKRSFSCQFLLWLSKEQLADFWLLMVVQTLVAHSFFHELYITALESLLQMLGEDV